MGLALLWALVCPMGAHGAVPVEAGVKVLVRVLSYDHALAGRLDGELRLGVVFDPSDPMSAAQAAAMRDAIHALAAHTTIAGAQLADASLLAFDPDHPSGVAPEERFAGLTGVVLCRGVEELVPDIVRVATELDLVTLTLEEGWVAAGVAIGVAQQQAKLQILVNLAAAEDQGLDLGSELLQLVRVVDPTAD